MMTERLPAPPDAITARRRRALKAFLHADVVGAAIAVLLGGAIAWAALDDGGRPAPMIGLLALTTATYVAARFAGRWVPWLIPAAVVIAVAILFAPYLNEVASGGPLARPLGYANANAALLFQGAVAAAVVSVFVPIAAVRIVAMAFAIAAVALAGVSGSEAVIVLVALTPAVVLAVAFGLARLVAPVLGVIVVGTVLATTALGATFRLGPEASAAQAFAERLVSERRLELWRDAFVLMRDQPVTGVGPGRFSVTSPTALADPDASWAHQEFLQIGAEAGGPAMVLLLALFVWALVRLRSDRGLSAAAGIAAFGIAALGLHASVDYVLHFWQVPIAAAALAGVAVDRQRHTV